MLRRLTLLLLASLAHAGPVLDLHHAFTNNAPPAGLATLTYETLGKKNLETGNARSRVEETTVAVAILSEAGQLTLHNRTTGKSIAHLTKLPNNLHLFAGDLPNFSDFDFTLDTTDGQTVGTGHLHIEHYPYTTDSLVHPDVPRGRTETFTYDNSLTYPDTTRQVLVYIPAQYDPKNPPATLVFGDGLRHADPDGALRTTTVLDNLIHQQAIPPTVGIFIDPGRLKSQKPGTKPSNRSLEYDSLGDTYATFVIDEIIPLVTEKFDLVLADDPAMRMTAGGSSAGICAWTLAWERPDYFRKVLCWVGTFVDIRGGNAYPSLIRKTEPKPIRAYLLAGENDLDNQFGNWPLANQQMHAALTYAGYEHHFHYGKCFHGSKHAAAMLPEMFRYLWHDYDPNK